MQPPPRAALGFKKGSQTAKAYNVLRESYKVDPHLQVPLTTILRFVGNTTNHRRMMCNIRKELKDPMVVHEYGAWTVPPACVEGSKSWYWLERSN